jgi:hypothetical protein
VLQAGEIVSIGGDVTGLMVPGTAPATRAYRVDAGTSITVDRQRAKLRNLKVGWYVLAGSEGASRTLVSIRALTPASLLDKK